MLRRELLQHYAFLISFSFHLSHICLHNFNIPFAHLDAGYKSNINNNIKWFGQVSNNEMAKKIPEKKVESQGRVKRQKGTGKR